MKTKEVSWYARRIILLVITLVGITLFFVYSNIMERAFQSVAKLETDPAFTGGRIAEVFYDPVGDDHGFGRLVYPSHPDFVPGSLDLVRYTVHEPVYNAKWSDLSDYWQLDMAFSAKGNQVRNIRIYIDADGDGNGNTLPRDEMAEGVTFDPSAPWDYVVVVEGLKGTFMSADGNFSEPLFVISRNNDKEIVIRIPLSDRRLNGLFTVNQTAQYVCVGGWTPWGRDGYIPVSLRAGAGSGGGAPSSLTPKIFDYLAPESRSQEDLLSSWNDDTLDIPAVFPVIASMQSIRTGMQMNKKADSVLLEKLKALAATEAEQADLASGQALQKISDIKSFEYAELQFQAGKKKEAEASFDGLLVTEPDNAKVLAYKGSLVAIRGGDASPLAAVDIIAEAYRYMDRAVALAQQSDEILTARLNRAYVSKSVPDVVFGKALEGASDFLAAAAEYRSLDEGKNAYVAEIASAYMNAALCFEIGGKNEDAGSWFREAARLVMTVDASGTSTIPSSLRLVLVERGYLEK